MQTTKEQIIISAAQELGRRGGLATKKKHGVDFFRKIGKRGGRPKKEVDKTER